MKTFKTTVMAPSPIGPLPTEATVQATDWGSAQRLLEGQYGAGNVPFAPGEVEPSVRSNPSEGKLLVWLVCGIFAIHFAPIYGLFASLKRGSFVKTLVWGCAVAA